MARIISTVFGSLMACFLVTAASNADQIEVVNLVTNDQSANPAGITDASLKNAWGVSHGTSGPFWVSANGSGLSTLYSVDPTTNTTTKLGLEVTIQGNGSVTGQAFNAGAGTGAFNDDTFLFVSEDGTVSGWRSTLGTIAEILQSPSPNAVYTGSAFLSSGGHSYLLSANFHSGNIDVLKEDVGAPDLGGKFLDPNLPAGFAPYNVETIGNSIFVTYAKQGTGGGVETGAGLGFVTQFGLDGTFLARVGTGGMLNAPWGLAIAPSAFSGIGGDLLVGNFGDGTINIFDLDTNSFVGQLSDFHNNLIQIDGLRALILGNDASAGSSSKVYFSAGPNGGANGVFGVLQSVPEPSSILMSGIGSLMLLACGIRARRGR